MGKSSNPTFAGDKEFEKIHLKEKFSYGLGDVACNVVYALTTSLLIYFYTNVVGISAAMIGTIMLFSRFFDVYNFYSPWISRKKYIFRNRFFACSHI